jgi:opacity protein-like surface antigen
MKTLQLTTWISVSFALIAPAAAAEWFVRPSALYVDYQNSDFADKSGLSLAAGATLGPRAAHELSLEVASLGWSLSQAGPWLTTGSGHFTACLANYRFRFGDPGGRIRFQVGPSVGVAHVRGDLTQYRFGVIVHRGLAQWPAAFAGTAGVTVKLGESSELDLNYRYLYIAGTNFGAMFLQLPAARANVFQAGLGFRF